MRYREHTVSQVDIGFALVTLMWRRDLKL
jgi:hypothetical protein